MRIFPIPEIDQNSEAATEGRARVGNDGRERRARASPLLFI